MNIKVLLNRTTEWLKGQGPDADIVISSRIRLARNIMDLPFPHRANDESRRKALGIVGKAIKASKHMHASLYVQLNGLDVIDKQFLVERHLMSKHLAEETRESALAVGQGEVISVMINEEDHLRVQVLRSGFQLREAWGLINTLDDEFEKSIHYAFSPVYGYLTCCPTNVGTGMRASVMMHIPALVLSKQVNQVIQAVLKLGLAVRGLYGEGTEPSGNLFQMSNQVTLGTTEEDIIVSLEKVIRQIVTHERNARVALLRDSASELQDRVWRAYGLLKNARVISSKETIELLSALRLGVSLEILKGIDVLTINELFMQTQPAHLQEMVGRELDADERDFFRAELIRRKLAPERKGK